ncbi:MAG: DNA primase, partial [Fibrobacter sp.]|nr:DNA primase [Fibrobacter sp.]
SSADDWLGYLASQRDLRRPEERAEFVSYTKSLVKSIGDRELQNQYLKLISERFNTDRSLAQVRPIKQEKNTLQQNANQEGPAIQWHAIPPIEIRFATLLLRNPTLMDRALEYFDMDWATSGIQMFESPVVEEFVNTVVALYAETGAISPQLLYESVSPEMQAFIEGLSDEQWKPPQEIYEFYQTLTVLSTKLCDRQKKDIALDTTEKVNTRMEMTKFTQGMQTINNMLNTEKMHIDNFADQVVRSKSRLIQFQAILNGTQEPPKKFAQEPPEAFAAEPPKEFAPPEPPENFEPPEPPEDEDYAFEPDESSGNDDMGF